MEKAVKSFDMSRYFQRFVALRISYIGWNYDGFVVQESTKNTVEEKLFDALKKTCLCVDPVESSYARCGRTDKAVSAFSQVVSLFLRSNVCEGLGVVNRDETPVEAKKFGEKELEFPRMLNRVLPEDIRVTGWSPIPLHFSARFSCTYRRYKYFFLKQDLNKMKEAASKLIGEHDFRNFCKIDVQNVKNFVRTIYECDFECCSGTENAESPLAVYAFVVKGRAFLWHQVRAMMAVLFLVGREMEDPDVVDLLLDIDRTPRKPTYEYAPPEPLVLYECGFDGLEWSLSEDSMKKIQAEFAKIRNEQQIRLALHDAALSSFTFQTQSMSMDTDTAVQKRGEKRRYVSLLERPTEQSLEEKIQRMEEKQEREHKRRKLDYDEGSE